MGLRVAARCGQGGLLRPAGAVLLWVRQPVSRCAGQTQSKAAHCPACASMGAVAVIPHVLPYPRKDCGWFKQRTCLKTQVRRSQAACWPLSGGAASQAEEGRAQQRLAGSLCPHHHSPSLLFPKPLFLAGS